MRVYVGDTDAEAREIERDLQLAAQDFDKALAELGRPFAWHDFRQYDLDAPFPQEALKHAERGFRTNAEHIAKLARDRDLTLRQTVESISSPRPTPFAGAPATVADQITRWFDARALDGINYHIANPAQWRRFREEVVPILQERGIVRRRVRLHHPPRQPRPPRPGEPPHRRPPGGVPPENLKPNLIPNGPARLPPPTSPPPAPSPTSPPPHQHPSSPSSVDNSKKREALGTFGRSIHLPIGSDHKIPTIRALKRSEPIER